MTDASPLEQEAAVLREVERIEDGWCGGTQPLYLYRSSRGLTNRGEIVEIGTYAGKSTTALALGQKHGGGRPIHTVDLAAHPRVEENLIRSGVRDWVRRLIGASREVAASWTLQIELLFIDAGHSYDDVRADIESWTPFVIEKGLVVLHDYPGWEESGARSVRHAIHKAVHELLMNAPDRWQVVSDREYGSLIAFRRINPPPRILND